MYRKKYLRNCPKLNGKKGVSEIILTKQYYAGRKARTRIVIESRRFLN
jgi:hypothetical protein